MTKVYEFVVLFSPELNEHQLQQAQGTIQDLAKKNGGTFTQTDVWGKKVLAYPIEKHTEAFYVFYTLEIDSRKVQGFAQDVRLSGLTIRHLLVIQDEAIVPAQAQAEEK